MPYYFNPEQIAEISNAVDYAVEKGVTPEYHIELYIKSSKIFNADNINFAIEKAKEEYGIAIDNINKKNYDDEKKFRLGFWD